MWIRLQGGGGGTWFGSTGLRWGELLKVTTNTKVFGSFGILPNEPMQS